MVIGVRRPIIRFQAIREWYQRYVNQPGSGGRIGVEGESSAMPDHNPFERATTDGKVGEPAQAQAVHPETSARESEGAPNELPVPSGPQDIFDKVRAFDRADDLMQAGLFPYFKPIAFQRGNRVIVEGREMLMACSNDYLGLSQDPRVKDASRGVLSTYGTSCTGSRFLNGTLSVHEELERNLATFLGKEKVLTFSAGFLGCLSVIAALTGRHDILYFDRENHASLYDGARLTLGTMRRYRHNDTGHLAKLLAADEGKPGGRLIVTDGVFSMSGHIANLPKIVQLAKQYGARVLVDDAHSTGVLGANGRGTAEHFDLNDEVDLILGTFSKAFASVGGFVAGESGIVAYIKHVARPFIFTAASPAMSIAATAKSLEILRNEPEHRYRLWKNIDMFRSGLNQLGFDTMGSKGPIVPILVGEEERTLGFWKSVWDEGIFALPALSPGVPAGECLIRMAINATHSVEDIQHLLVVYGTVGRRLGVID